MRALVVLAGLALVLSGCTGGSDSSAVDDTTTTAKTSDAPTTNIDGSGVDIDEDEKPVFNPYHQHNLWNDRKEVWLFQDFSVTLNEDESRLPKETWTTGSAIFSGKRCFRFADDSKYTADSSDGADVVFQGASRVEYKITWTPDTQAQLAAGEYIDGLVFTYKHAGTSLHDDQPIINGEWASIPIYEGMADMAHQSQLSRWAFCLVANDDTIAESAPARAEIAKGTAKVSMKAIYGGKDSIDDPHPFFYVDVTERHVGEKNGTVDPEATRLYPGSITGNDEQEPIENNGAKLTFTTDDKKLIPWDTNELRGYFDYNFTDADPAGMDRSLMLYYSDASGPTVKPVPSPTVTEYSSTNGARIAFKITLAGTVAADDPYADSSDWIWYIRPMINGEEELGGSFKGSYHLKLIGEGDDSEVVQR